MADDFTIPNQRKGDWIDLLRVHCETWGEGNEFAWGTHDCFQFVAAGIKSMTDRDVFAGIKYKSLKQGLALLNKGATIKGKKVKGPKTAEGFWTMHFGEPKPVSFAQRGDIVLFENSGRPYSGIMTGGEAVELAVRPDVALPGLVGASGNQVWVLTDKGTRAALNRSEGSMAWSV